MAEMISPEEEDDEDFDNNPLPLVELVAENLEIYARQGRDRETRLDQDFLLMQAARLLHLFEETEGRSAADYLELEEWSRLHPEIVGTVFLVIDGMPR